MNPRIVTVHPGKYLQCRTYAVIGASGVLLIDPGSGFYDAEVVSGLRAFGAAPADVKAVLLTHYHVDHALGLGHWQGRGVALMASLPTARGLRSASPMIWGEHPELLTPIEVDDVLTDGQEICRAGVNIECVSTPGHTAGCMSYVVATREMRAAFTGDVLMPDGQPGWAGDICFSAQDLMQSLRRLQTLELTQVFPGHGEIEGDVDSWLAAGIALGLSDQWHIAGALNSFAIPQSVDS